MMREAEPDTTIVGQNEDIVGEDLALKRTPSVVKSRPLIDISTTHESVHIEGTKQVMLTLLTQWALILTDPKRHDKS